MKPLRHIMAGKDMLLYHASQLSRGEEKMSSFFSYVGSLRIAWVMQTYRRWVCQGQTCKELPCAKRICVARTSEEQI